ncbi:MAG TPA: hypothetical protein VK403_03550 [Allosphingosinicella sp.]|nr:hypothetical protein [Allosphingosinicella sp.]
MSHPVPSLLAPALTFSGVALAVTVPFPVPSGSIAPSGCYA